MKTKPEVGDVVVISEAPDATLYTVDGIKGYGARLSYETAHGTASVWWIDISLLSYPSCKQLNQGEHCAHI